MEDAKLKMQSAYVELAEVVGSRFIDVTDVQQKKQAFTKAQKLLGPEAIEAEIASNEKLAKRLGNPVEDKKKKDGLLGIFKK
jgi:hypothetical protein